MLGFIKKGKLLEQGIKLYQQKDFTKAIDVFNQALIIEGKDFAVNFWLARSQTMLGNYVIAKELLNKCGELEPKVIELLIIPWESLIQSLESNKKFDCEQLSHYDVEADSKLFMCYFKNQYSFRELLIISFILLLGGELIELNPQSHWGLGFAALLITVIQLGYFHFNTLLPLNLWLRYRWMKEQIQILISNSSFMLLTVGFIIISLIVVDRGILSTIQSLQMDTTTVHETIREHYQRIWIKVPYNLLVGPIAGELTFRLVWYNYLAKYNKYIAYFGVSLFIMLLQGSPAQFFMSLFLIWIYNKYNTILAPIILHFTNNFFLLLLPQINKILFF